LVTSLYAIVHELLFLLLEIVDLQNTDDFLA